MTTINSIKAIDKRQLLYFALTSGFFLLLNIDIISINQLSLVYLALFALFLFNDKPKLQFNLNWTIYSALAALAIYLSYVGSQHPEHAIIKTQILRDLGLLGFAFYLVTRTDLVNYSETFLIAMIVAFLLVTPTTLWEYLGAAKQQLHSAKYFSPELSYYWHIRHFSYHAFIAAAFSVILLLNAEQRSWWRYALGIICALVLIITTGRAAIASYALFLILIGFRWLSLGELIKRIALVTAIAAAALFVLWLSPASSIVDSIVQRTQISFDLNTLLSGRPDIWRSGLDAARPYPILGMGPDSFVLIHDRLSGTSQPHNVLVQLILDYGWLGTSIILFCALRLLGPLLFRESPQRPESKLPFLLSCFIVSYTVYALFDGMFYYPLPMLHFIVVVAILFNLTAAAIPPSDPVSND